MLIIKTVTGQMVNADSIQLFAVEHPNDKDHYIVRAKTENCQTRIDLGYYWSPETAVEELNKLSDFLSKRNNGIYTMADITQKGEGK
ncbi:hypothetical protein [Faecalibaculum rodentium]|jgi:hypothetical protein|uniref:hypothetical protein n=1 Tax=Faecalibaculum rodentium TaxID=1702221 RepID=UPI0025A55F6A|nr:hypothetical protein [Faecalibaculum rodentium]